MTAPSDWNLKTKIKGFFSKVNQVTYMTCMFYFDNKLGTAANSCTFGFIFSFIPILMVIITSCIGILKTNSGIAEWIINWASQFDLFFSVEDYIQHISQMKSITGINIVLAFFIIWMARKLFASTIDAMNCIFRRKTASRPVLDQIFTFAGEVILVIICVLVFFLVFLSRQILTLPFFQRFREYAPWLFSILSNNLVHMSFYAILFLFALICYKVTSHTKPKFRLCVLNAAICVIVFYIVVSIVSHTINRANYDSIYGVLSNLMIMLFEVWVFFSIFLVCAQMLYVEQFFDSLLIGELYLLPEYDAKGFSNTLRRVLFITPSSLMKKENMERVMEGEPVYLKDNPVDGIYFIVEGKVCEHRNNSEIIHEKGTSFGEPEFLLNTDRISETYALTDCTLLKIPSADFAELIQKNPTAASKAIRTISIYTENFSEYIY